jgi:hypothetical protein
MRKKTFRKLEVLLHFLTALLFLLKGCDELNRRLYFPGTILLGLSLTLLTINGFWRSLRIKPRQARISSYYLESPALFLISYVLFLEKQEFMPYIFLIAAILYPAMGFISSKKFKRIKNQPL